MFQRMKRSVVSAAAVAALAIVGLTSPPAAHAADCSETVLAVVAHQDDDLLFMNPDLLGKIAGGACVVSVFVTAGDAGAGTAYWSSRERGSQAAYSAMLGQAGNQAWTTGQATFAGHSVAVATSPGGRATGIYLRLPDGGIGGGGWSVNGEQSLLKLWQQSIPSVDALDGANSYTRDGLIASLSAIIAWSHPTAAFVQDAREGQYDHSDHRVAGRFALAALQGFTGAVTAYRGYGAQTEPANVLGDQLTAKTGALLSYAQYDPMLCNAGEPCPGGNEAVWMQRQYTAPLVTSVVPVPGPAAYEGPNVARNGLVAVSSQAAGQGGTAAIDAVVGGWPGNGGAEWSSEGERAGAWLSLSWAVPQVLDRVYLFDRPNGVDQVTGGVLTFSDGSSVVVPALNNDGSATVVTFAQRSVSSMVFTVSSVSGGTQNVGLAEIEAYAGDPTLTPGQPEVVPVPGPAAYEGPNVARNGLVAVSSQAAGQGGTAAIDAVVGGWPGNGGAEWSSQGERAGAWLSLSWAVPQVLDRVYLFDRPNGVDQVTGGVLTFSDGSSVVVPALNNDGSATVVTFAQRSVSSMVFTVSSVSGGTQNVGLAEIEAYAGDPTLTPGQPEVVPDAPARTGATEATATTDTDAAVPAEGQDATGARDNSVVDEAAPDSATIEPPSDDAGPVGEEAPASTETPPPPAN